MNELNKVLESNYYNLKKLYCSKNPDLEDMFHTSIVNMLSNSDKFIFISEVKTLSYIKAYLYNDKRAQQKKKYLNKIVFVEIEELNIGEE